MTDRPNIILITCHDTGRHFGCYGVDTVETPAVDRLAADGYLFDNHFASSPVCSPSRGAMLTGRYPQSNGLMGLTHSPWDWSLHDGERHLSHVLSEAGYHTRLFGIQHEAQDIASLRFDQAVLARKPNGSRATADEVGRAVAEFLTTAGAAHAPFYLQVGFFETHRPFEFGDTVPDDGKGVFVPPYLVDNPAAISDLSMLQGAVRRVDQAVEHIRDGLEKAGLDDDTLVIFTVDHGLEVPRAKWFLYDAGIETALIMRWPGGGICGGKTSSRLVGNVDLFPTLLELAGIDVPDTVQGHSFKTVFTSDGHESDEAAARSAVFAMFESNNNVSRCVRTNRYKFIRNFAPRRSHVVPIDIRNEERKVKCPVVELYDLDQDPYEYHNLAFDEDQAGVRSELSQRLWAWMEDVGDPLLHGPVPTPYYREAMMGYAGTTT